jgi:hypothetical protein
MTVPYVGHILWTGSFPSTGSTCLLHSFLYVAIPTSCLPTWAFHSKIASAPCLLSAGCHSVNNLLGVWIVFHHRLGVFHQGGRHCIGCFNVSFWRHYFLFSALSVFLCCVYIMLLLKSNLQNEFLLCHLTGNPPYVWSHNKQRRMGSGSEELNIKPTQQLHWYPRMVKLNNDGDQYMDRWSFSTLSNGSEDSSLWLCHLFQHISKKHHTDIHTSAQER